MRTSSATLRHIRHAACIMGALAALLAATPLALAQHVSRPERASHYGGSLTAAYPLAVSCLDPAKSNSGPIDALFDTLVTEDGNGHIHPGLAIKWKARAGGKQIDFTLRQGVKFSNGDPLTAFAVQASIERDLSPAIKSPVAATYLSSVASTKVVSKYVIRLGFKAPYRPILADLATYWTGIMDAKAMDAEGDNSCSEPIGTGPFKLKSIGTAFSSITMVRNPYHTFGSSWYFNKGKPYLSTLTFQMVTDPTTQVSELLTGDVDYVRGIVAAEYNRVSGDSRVKLYKHDNLSAAYLLFNITRRPFDNPAVRRAVSEAVDRVAVAKAANGPFGFPEYGPWPPSLGFYDKSLKALAVGYKPGAAQTELASRGVNGSYTLLTINIPALTTAAEFIQGELAQVGLNMKIDAVLPAQFISEAAKRNWDFCFCSSFATDPDQLLTSVYQPGSPGNWFPQDRTLDPLITKGRTTLSSRKADQYYVAAQRFIVKNAWIDPLYGSYGIDAIRTRVHGWQVNDFASGPVYQSLYVK